MREEYLSLCRELEAQLGDSMENNAQRMLERDEVLQSEMEAFQQSLSPTQVQHWQVIRQQVDALRQYSKLAKLRLMDGDENVKVLIDRVKNDVETSEDHTKAMLDIEREMHDGSSLGGVIKALFMWKTAPEEKIEQDKV